MTDEHRLLYAQADALMLRLCDDFEKPMSEWSDDEEVFQCLNNARRWFYAVSQPSPDANVRRTGAAMCELATIVELMLIRERVKSEWSIFLSNN